SKGFALQEELVKGRVKQVRGEGAAPTRVSYFKGRDQSKWKNNVNTYDMVSLGEVYEGVDVKLRAYGSNVEKLFYVKPGADADAIRLRLEGADGLKINAAGELEIETDLGPVAFTAPIAYQEADGKKRDVKVAYAVNGNEYGFSVGEYDRTKELVIDPLLASTYIGASNNDSARSISVDQIGNVYISGRSDS
ncbi:MAG: hypothetical protein GY859_12245, partial [Desulfobacterales bacterium]|nr:hypothetical protein [Desulfobacterales bacterium]